MTKSLGNKYPQPSELEGKRSRTLISLSFDAFFPLLIVVLAYMVGRDYFTF
jgi:hypothetical protein